MNYKITAKLKEHIAEKLNVDPENVGFICDFFHKVKDHKDFGFEQQYLSHLIRTMECHLRDKTKNPLFCILLEKLPDDDSSLGVGTAKYFHNRYFSIYYHPQMEKKQLRVCLAHELGHLFCAALLEKEIEDFNPEPISTLFGIFSILDKDEFYTSQAKKLCHESPKAIVDSFVQMNNRREGLYNIS